MPLQPVALADTYRNITLKQNEQASPLTTLTANAVTDTLTLVAGPGISFGTGNVGDQIVIFNDFGDENATLSIRAIQIDGFNIDTNVIQLTDSNADLEIRANGSGQVYITDSLRVQDNLTVDGNTILGNAAADTITINGTAISTPNTITLTTDDATNNGIIYPVSFSHTTTATPANGIGTGIQFITETTANNNEIGLQIASVVTDTTAASEDFDFVIRQMIAGAAPAQTLKLNFNTIQIGANNTDLRLTTQGTSDLTIDTNSGTNSGYIKIFDGANANIEIVPNGTGTLIIGTQNWLAANTDTFFVSATNGSNTNDGRRMNTAFATVAYALSQAASGDTIQILPGTYTEVFPLTIPQGVTVRGSGIRSTILKPTAGTNSNDCFLLNGETTVEELTIADMFYNSGANTGYAFRFNTAATVTVASRSPYIQRVTVINKGSTVTASDPYGFVSANAGRGVYIDGSRVTRASLEAAILFNECTFIVPNSRACIMTNGARTEWLNCFTYFADLAIEGVVGASGRGADGKTYISLTGTTGTWNVGNSLRYYANDGTTILAQGVIEAISGNTYTLDGSVSGFKTNANRDNKTVLVHGSAQLSTTSPKFGASSLRIASASSDYISLISDPDFGFGTGDFTVEFFWKPDAIGTQQILLDMRTTGTEVSLYIEMSSAGNLRLFVNGSYRITSSNTCTAAAWNHVAIYRSGTDTRVALNGTVSTTYTDSGDYGSSKPFKLGTSYTATSFTTTGYFDEVRIVKGVAKYGTSNFTQPSSAFVGDSNTVLLLHLNGSNGSTVIVDDGITIQDIRSTGGGTATGITRYDRKEFAAEMRSISSANVYGNQGVKADGVDVVIQLMAHNFAYIGTGYDLTNNKATVNQANEVIEVNTGRVFYESVDQEGNFRIGDFFSVDFETGAVTFSGANFDVSSLTGINFTSGSNTTVIDPTQVATGNIIISGNTISTQAGGITIDPTGNNTITINGSTTLSGDFVLGGALTIDDASNSSVSSPLTVRHTTSGTPANGIGTGITFVTETANDTNRTGMILEAASTDVTSGSEDFSFNLKLMAAGAAASTKFSVSSVGDTVIEGDLAVNGGDLTTDQTTFNLLQTNATTVNFAGESLEVNFARSADIDSLFTFGPDRPGGALIPGVTTFETPAGVSIPSPGTYLNVPDGTGGAIGGGTAGSAGQGATFNIVKTGTDTNYFGNVTITLVDRGEGYAIGDEITILGSNLGGTSPENDMVFIIGTEVTPGNTIKLAGTGVGTVGITSDVTTGNVNLFTNLSGSLSIGTGALFTQLGGDSAVLRIGNIEGNSKVVVFGQNDGTGIAEIATNTGVSSGKVFNEFVTVGELFGYAQTVDISSTAPGASILNFGSELSDNTIFIKSISSGNITISSDVTTGVVNLFPNLSTGTVNIGGNGGSFVNIGGGGTYVTIGANSGNSILELVGELVSGTVTVKTSFGVAVVNLFNDVNTTGNLFGSARTINIGDNGGDGTLTIKNDNVVLDGDLQVKGGDLTTDQTTFNLLSTNATTVNFADIATTLNLGKSATAFSTLTFGPVLSGNIFKISGIAGGTTSLTSDVTTGTVNLYTGVTTGTVNLATGGASTTNIGGAGSIINLGTIGGNTVLEVRGDAAAGGTATIRTNVGVMTVNVFNTQATTANLFGAATNIEIGSTSGTTSINHSLTVDGDTTLGNASTDTVTINADSVAIPNTLTFTTNDANTNTVSFPIKLVHGTTGTPQLGIGTGIQLITETTDGVNRIGATIESITTDINSSTEDFDFVIRQMIAGNAAVQTLKLNSTTLQVGANNIASTITTQGTSNLTLSTNNGTNSGTIVINNGVNGNIVLTPNGTGDVYLDADTLRVGDSNSDTYITSNGESNLTLKTGNSIVLAITSYVGAGTTTVTGNLNAHGLVAGDIITISGATTTEQSKLNGTWTVATASANSFTFVISIALTAATYTTNIGTTTKVSAGYILINQGTNGNIVVEPHGTGDFQVNADTFRLGDNNLTAYLITNGTANLVLNPGTDIVLGNDASSATPSARILRATNGDGTNISAANLQLQGGLSTGNATGGSITFTTGTTLTTGTALQSGTDRMSISPSSTNTTLDLVTAMTTANLFNSTATTVNFVGAATTLNIGNSTAAQTISIGNASTDTSTYNFATGPTASSKTKTINIATGGATGSTTNVNIGSSVAGTTTINSGTIVGALITQNLFNTIATTINFGGVAENIEIGASTGTTNINHNLDVDGDVNIDGGDLTVSTTTFNLANTNATTLNLAGAATAVNVGVSAASASTLTFGPTITGNIFEINSTAAGTVNLTSDVTTGTVNLYTGVTTGTVNLATGGASTTNIGGPTALVNIGTTTANSVLEVRGNATNGITTIRTNAGVTTANLFNTEVLTANLFGVGSAINIALNAATATTLTLGSSLNSNNTFEINSTQAGAINLTSDITTGTVNLYTGVTTGTVNLATGGASTTNIGGDAALVNIGTSSGNSTLTIGGNSTSGTATVVTNAATANVFDTNSTTVNAFGDATAVNIGANTGTVTISNPVITQSNATSVTFNMNGPTPTIASDQASGTADIFNTNITTLNLSNAATTLNLGNAAAAQTINIGNASTAASTYNFGTGVTASATTKTINLGTSGASGSTTNVNIGSNAGGTTTINSGTLVGSSTLQNVFATTAITVNAFLAATTIEIGADSGTLEINNPTVVGSQTTQNVFNTVATTVNAFGAAETINTGAAGNSGVYTINNDNVVLLGDLQVKGGDLTTNKTTFNLLNNTVQTLNFVGAASTINIANFNTQLNYLGTSNLGSVNIAKNMVIEGDIIAKRDVEIRGSLNLTGDINGGPLRTDDIQIVGNRIETTASNSDFEINTQGVGNILLLADTKQTGTIQVNSQLTINTNSITTVSGNTDLVFTAHGTGRINLETVAISGNNIDTTDSSGISITPSVNFESDIIAENGIITRANIVPNVNMTHNLGELTKRFASGHFGEVTLVTDLLVEYGGTGVSSFTSKGILYGNGSNPLQVTAASDPGVSNQTTSYGVLTTDVNNVPIWTDVIDGGSY